MPKKFASENTKSVAARERKKTAKETEAAKKQQSAEDELWKDENKQAQKRQQKKDEQDKKKLQQLEKKAEAKALLEQEMSSIKPAKPAPSAKVTRAQIGQIKPSTSKEVPKVEIEEPVLVENVNRLVFEGDEARTVTEAISILSSKNEEIDMHPEKRMKAAYNTYEQRRLVELKEENPSLRLSQLKQMIFKEWQKSPENPLNKAKE